MTKRYNDTITHFAYEYKDRRVPREILRAIQYIYGVRFDRVKNDIKKAQKAFEED